MVINETQNAPSWAPIAVAVALVAGAWGSALYFDAPLESQRPPNPSTMPEAPQHRQFPFARLWQDPLHAVYAHWNAADRTRESIPFITDAAICDRDVLRLLVMMPGTPYSNDRETRRRQRHAVVTALTHKDFVPSDEARLRYFRAPPFQDFSATTATDPSNDPTLVAYETYEPAVEPERSRWASVAVFWLNAEDFLRYPLHKVSALVAVLDWRRCPDSETVLLGPPSSGVLRAMLEEPEEAPAVVTGFLRKIARDAQQGQQDARQFESLASSARKARGALRVFSSRATIPVDRLCRPDDVRCRTADTAAYVTRRLRVVSFHSTIADDGRVLEAILRELVDRGACEVKGDSPRVAIVSEQDTLYGRLLGGVAEHAAEQVGKQEGCKIQITEYGYLQGVDGESLGVEGPTRQEETASGGADAAGRERAIPFSSGGTFEQPFGPARLDYARRLADLLPGDGPNAPVAIGVLGNDVYDKLLILQALRERRPGVVFFTTDMDARLLTSAVRPWTWNLIVGSAYGLCRSEPTVTFRDSYQAALFAAVQQVLDLEVHGAPEPRLFEISRTGVVPLDSLGSQDRDWKECDWKDSNWKDRDWKETVFLLTPLAALAVFAAVMFIMRQWEETARARRQMYGLVAISAAVVAVGLFVFVQFLLPRQEPGPLFDGVSAVPMVTLQITTIFFAVAVVAFAGGRMRHALFHVADRLREKEPDRGLKVMCTAVRRSCRTLKQAAVQRNWWTLGGVAVQRNWWTLGGVAVRRLRTLKWTAALAVLSRWWNCLGLVSTWKSKIAGSEGSFKTAAELWSELWHHSRWGRRCARIFAVFSVGWTLRWVYFASVRLEQPLLGQEVTAPGWVKWMLPVMVFWAISYCRDTLSMWLAFIRAVGRFDVTGGRTEDSFMRNEAANRGRWSMDLLVRCTDLVGPVVVLPLILMVLLLLSRSTIFEGWNWTAPLVVFHVGLAVYVLFMAVEFQREASHGERRFSTGCGRRGSVRKSANRPRSRTSWSTSGRAGRAPSCPGRSIRY